VHRYPASHARAQARYRFTAHWETATPSAQIRHAGASHPARIPIRTLAVAATDDGRRAPGKGRRHQDARKVKKSY